MATRAHLYALFNDIEEQSEVKGQNKLIDLFANIYLSYKKPKNVINSGVRRVNVGFVNINLP